MKTALFIHSYAKANDTVQRHWPFYRRSGMDLFGIGRTNTKCLWPEPIPTKDIGLDAYVDGDNLCRRLVDTFDWFITDDQFKDYTHAMVIEYDSIFLRPPPEITIEAGGTLAGGKYPGMKASQFYHCPWWLDRARAQIMVEYGHKLLDLGEIELGTPDFFFARVMEDNHVCVQNLCGTFSRNTVDSEQSQKECNTLIKSGILWFIHGIKTPQQLNAIVT